MGTPILYAPQATLHVKYDFLQILPGKVLKNDSLKNFLKAWQI